MKVGDETFSSRKPVTKPINQTQGGWKTYVTGAALQNKLKGNRSSGLRLTQFKVLEIYSRSYES